MPREIKFRAWNGEKYLNEVNISNSGRMIIFEYGEYAGYADYPIEQYTGLKDKNGTEIYEGDIVQYQDFGKNISHTITQELSFNCGCCSDVYGWDIPDQELEIIGNIHERKEI